MTTADLIFHGGSLFSAGASTSRPAAVAVSDGVIIAIESDADILKYRGPSTEVIDLAGGLLLPGFQDAHVHPLTAGIELQQCDLSGAEDAADCLRLIGEYAAAHPDLDWILGGGWSMDFFPGGVPTRHSLDEIVPDRPVLLMNRDHHDAWVNSVALNRAGVTAATPDPSGGRIARDTDGSPIGTLHEAAFELMSEVRPSIDLEFAYAGLLKAQDKLFSLGITGWQDAYVPAVHANGDFLDAYLLAIERGTLRARVTAGLWWEREEGLEQLPFLADRRARAAAAAPAERFTAGTVKIMVDGVAENQTAAMSSPYLDACGHATDNSGLSFIDKDKLKDYVTALDASGFQVHFHALGDRGVSEALDAVEAARTTNGTSAIRHHLAHLQVIAKNDVARFAELNASANLQSLWACRDKQSVELTYPFLEPELIVQHYPFGDLERAGTHLVAGSDWPVSSANPLLATHVAVNRTEPGGSSEPPLGEGQGLSLATALTAYTAGSATINGRDDIVGRIEVGYLADLTVLDRDPFTRPVGEIAETSVVSTWIDGVCVFNRDER